MPQDSNANGHFDGGGGDTTDGEFWCSGASPFVNPVADFRAGAAGPENVQTFNLGSHHYYEYREKIDELGNTFIERINIETGKRERFIAPPPTARD